jgi:hypothetical protein
MDDTSNKHRNGNRNRHRQHKPNPAASYNPPYAEEILVKTIDQIGLSEQTITVLTAAKITTVGDIARRRMSDMYRVQNFGKRHLGDVSRCIAALGVDFRPDDRVAPTAPKSEPSADGRMQAGEGDSRRRDKSRDRGRDGQNRAQERGNQQPNANRDNAPKGQNAERKAPNANVQRDNHDGRTAANANVQRDNREGKKGKNKHQAKQFDESLTLENLFPKPKMVRLPRIEQETDEFVKFQRGGKWGFRNKSGVEVIPPIYDEVFNFKEDYACVERKQLFGYINRQNELVIPYKYVCASSFSEGYACVSDEEKCGYIDKSGEVVVPFKYEAGTAVKDGLAHVKLDGKWGTLTIATNTISWA